jgi:hypothetical protein
MPRYKSFNKITKNTKKKILNTKFALELNKE